MIFMACLPRSFVVLAAIMPERPAGDVMTAQCRIYRTSRHQTKLIAFFKSRIGLKTEGA
jgi:hypothetical protein